MLSPRAIGFRFAPVVFVDFDGLLHSFSEKAVDSMPVHRLLFLLRTGARLNEAMQAKWEQIDAQTGVWRIPAKNSKSKKGRAVPLNDSALWGLGQLGTKDKHTHLFVNEATNKLFVTITRAWYRLRAKAGIEGLRIYDLPHS